MTDHADNLRRMASALRQGGTPNRAAIDRLDAAADALDDLDGEAERAHDRANAAERDLARALAATRAAITDAPEVQP